MVVYLFIDKYNTNILKKINSNICYNSLITKMFTYVYTNFNTL